MLNINLWLSVELTYKLVKLNKEPIGSIFYKLSPPARKRAVAKKIKTTLSGLLLCAKFYILLVVPYCRILSARKHNSSNEISIHILPIFVLDRKQRAKRGSIAEIDIKQEPGKYIVMIDLYIMWKYLSSQEMGSQFMKAETHCFIPIFVSSPSVFGLLYAFGFRKISSWIFRFGRWKMIITMLGIYMCNGFMAYLLYHRHLIKCLCWSKTIGPSRIGLLYRIDLLYIFFRGRNYRRRK